ncbi:MAG: hypothetical protein JWQ89_1568 [Devosia sp.]|nr:hypothetical protein [Devosia sp.]MDB5539841.1 hypothetical protein [Devosia sp.]
MYKMFNSIRTWLAGLLVADAPEDPLTRMSPREFADLPVHHPRFDDCLSS